MTIVGACRWTFDPWTGNPISGLPSSIFHTHYGDWRGSSWKCYRKERTQVGQRRQEWSSALCQLLKQLENIMAGKYDSQRLFIVARKPDRFLRLVEAGAPLETLNVGNMSQSDETRPSLSALSMWLMRMWKLSTSCMKKEWADSSDGSNDRLRILWIC